MAEIVGGFLVPHDPGLFATAAEGPSPLQQRTDAAFAEIRDRIGALEATTVIVVGADHYVLFGPACLPTMLIGIGDVSGPIERFPGMEQGEIPNNEALAVHLCDYGLAHGFDWTVSKSLKVDHSVGAPARRCALPNPTVRGVIPIYLASGVAPLIAKRRAFELGGMIAAAVAAWPEPERVVVIGSGGMSHWVGLPQMGTVNAAFDREILESVARGDVASLVALDDGEIVERGGNGALEIRNFICAIGAMPGCTGRIIAYEHENTRTGLGFAELGFAEMRTGR
jgi:protocatechuate 4,5-dioxygenase beta chain